MVYAETSSGQTPIQSVHFPGSNQEQLHRSCGKGKGEEYMPQTGDYLINIDRGNLRELVHDLDAYEKVYSADENIKYGNLYRRN